jgi:hypothetical protein
VLKASSLPVNFPTKRKTRSIATSTLHKTSSMAPQPTSGAQPRSPVISSTLASTRIVSNGSYRSTSALRGRRKRSQVINGSACFAASRWRTTGSMSALCLKPYAWKPKADLSRMPSSSSWTVPKRTSSLPFPSSAAAPTIQCRGCWSSTVCFAPFGAPFARRCRLQSLHASRKSFSTSSPCGAMVLPSTPLSSVFRRLTTVT